MRRTNPDMKTHPHLIGLLGGFLLLAIDTPAQSTRAPAIDLSPRNLLEPGHRRVNTEISITKTLGREAVELQPTQPGRQQLLVLKGVGLRTGTIEFDLFATVDNPFVGVAFHVENDSSYEAVYFRPFRFKDSDPVNRRHAVQYVSEPERSWRALRTAFPDVYEKPCPLQPNQWHRMKLEIGERRVRVFAGDLADPVMVIERPFTKTGNAIALWTGVNTKGVFGDICIISTENLASKPSAKTTGGTTSIPPATGQAIDLLPMINPARDAVAGEWTRDDSGLSIGKPVSAGRCALPVPGELVRGGYDLNFTFTRTGGTDSVAAIIPVFGRQCLAVFGAFSGKWDGLGMIDGKPVANNSTGRASSITSNRCHAVSVRVRKQGNGSAAIAIFLDRKPYVSWSGKIEGLSLFDRWKLPASVRVGVGAFETTCTFHSIEWVAVR